MFTVRPFSLARRVGCLAAAITGLFLALPASGQSTFGSFVGTVHDASGAVVPNCIVTLVNSGTSAQRSTVTDKDGSYVLVNIEPGMYRITMQTPGFQVAEFSNLELTARQTVRVDGTLGIATQTETVNVTAANEAVITTEVSSIAETKSGRELVDLPVALSSRASGSTSAISTLTTQAGVQTDSNGAISVAGNKPSMLSISIDGISSMSARNSAPIAELFPSFGTIAEIRVSEVNNAAEFGGVSDITTVSKGGTNDLHGGLFENLQNTAMNARNPFAATKPKIVMNNFGGFMGGPVRFPKLYNGRDKTFFFMAYEGLRLPRQTTIVESVPSQALRGGDLSVYTKPVLDSSGNPFPGNQVPVSVMSPTALKAMQYLMPLPNTGAPNAIANNYVTNFGTPISSNQADLRIDQNINARQTFFARGTYKYRDINNVPLSTGTILAGALHQPETDFGVTAAHNFVITPRLVNEFRAGVNGTRTVTSSGIIAKDILAKIGLTMFDPPNGNASPNFNITGFQGTGSTASSLSKSQTEQFLDNLSYTHGSHTIKGGMDLRRPSGYFSNVFASSRVGQFTYNGSVTNSIVNNPFGAFLLGIPDKSVAATVTQPDSFSHSWHWAAYVQDDWKMTPRLTLNYGLRWEYHPPFYDKFNNLANFLPDYYSTYNGAVVRGAVVVPDGSLPLVNPTFAAAIAPTPIVTASQIGVNNTLHEAQYTSFAPRVGFAWRVTSDGKTVIRGGYGRFIETLLSALITAGWAVEGSNVGSYTNSLVGGKPVLTFPNPFPANLAQPGTATFELAAAQKYRDPYVQQWNLTIERNLGFNTGIRLSYDGNHGNDLGYTENLAQLPANTAGFATANKSAIFPLWAHISDYVNGARSNYHAFTASASKRFSNNLQFNSSYVFAKNLSNGAGYNPTAFAGESGGMVTDQFNPNLDYGNVAFTHRQRFLSTFLYNLPIGRGHAILGKSNKLVDEAVGGWQLSGVLLFQTGPFVTVVAPGADPAGNNFPNLEASGRADTVSGVSVMPAMQSVSQWINAAAFSIPKNNIGRPGNSSIGSVVGPGTQAVSLSLFKTFPIGERARLQLGAAASNALNHPNYTTPNTNLGTAAFGTISNVQAQENGGPRSLQVTGRISF
jgi:hypothetical protein